MKYFSMFSGIGGFEKGISSAGECVGYSEIDKYAISVYKRHFPKHEGYGDATTINTRGLPDFDLLVGGFPCQAFSIAGRRAGFDDTRGTLFFDVARILADKKPSYLVLENVKGLLSHDNGRTFQTILTVLTDLGYHIQWQVLNSKDFGVPQNRERIYIVGHLRGQPRPEIFPFGTTNGKTTQIYGRVTGLKGHDYLRRVYSKDGAAPTLPTGTGGNHHAKVFDQARVRRLTPLECERLQGFPDGWTRLNKDDELISDTQRYKMCGNAVTTNVVSAVIGRLLVDEEA